MPFPTCTVTIALTQAVEADRTRAAIMHEARLRWIPLPRAFALPTTWGRGYTKLAEGSAAVGHTFADARELMKIFVDPLLSGRVVGTCWNPVLLAWE